MTNIKPILIGVAKNSIPLIAKIFGTNLLDKEQTFKKLSFAKLFFLKSQQIEITPSKTYGGVIEEFKKKTILETSSIAVFCLTNKKKIKILNYGGIKLENDILNLDFGSSLYIKALFKLDSRKIFHSENCILLWSHSWGGSYYDFIFFIYAKFLRIKSIISEGELKKSKIIYPVFGTSFEKELWSFAGISEEQIFDVRKFNIKAKKYYLGSNQSWFYPHLYDVSLLCKTLQTAYIQENSEYERIYISRRGRRKLQNEEEAIDVLKGYGFKTIDDTFRSVLEQMTIYRSAKIILGPHGASFSNILWCKPKTKVIELFSNNYYPPYYRYLSKILGLEYYTITEENVQISHYGNLNEDIYVDPLILKNSLENILSNNSIL